MSKKYLMRRYDLVGGMDQATNPYLMNDSTHVYLKNVIHGEKGTLSKDGGYSQFLDNMPASSVDLLFDYQNHTYLSTLSTEEGEIVTTEDGDTFPIGVPNLLFAISDGDLYKETDSGWELVEADVTTSGQLCNAVNYLDRVYFAEADSVVTYTDGENVTTLQSDNGDLVKGKYLETLNNTLYLGNITHKFGPNYVLYTQPGSHVFFNPNEEDYDTYETTSHKIRIDGVITALKAYQGLMLIFTKNDLWYFNPDTFEVKQLAETGCVCHHSIREIDGILYWASNEGVYRFAGNNMPSIISLPITNKVVSSIWSNISSPNFGQMAAGVLGGKYYLWVGTLTAPLPGDSEPLKNVVVVYDTYRDVWTFYDNHPVKQWMEILNDEGTPELLFADRKSARVLIRDKSYNHDGQAIDMKIRTKYYDFDRPESEKTLEDLFVAYRPESTESYVNVGISVNGTNDYQNYVSDSSNTKLPLEAEQSLEYQFRRVSLNGTRARTVSYEIGNNDNATCVTLLGFTQEFSYMLPNLNYSTE